jgi:hypothetical protein
MPKLRPKYKNTGPQREVGGKAASLQNLVPPWPKGVSGNPAGKATGSRNRVTITAQGIFDRDARAISERCTKLARAGDPQAMREALARIVPPLKIKDEPVHFPMPVITSAAEAAAASAAILAAVGAGHLSPNEGLAISRLVEVYVKAQEVSALEARVAALEGRTVTLLEP